MLPGTNNYVTGIDPWADNSVHLTIINSFSKSDNLPPMNPLYAGSKMSYHILFDFYSGILNKLGLNLRYSILLPNIIFFSILFFLIYIFVFKITNNRKAAIVSVILIIFSGGFYFLEVLRDYNLKEIISGNYYSHWGKDYLMINIAINILTTRSSILGYAVLFLLFIYLIPFIQKNESLSKKQLIILGIIGGLFLFMHAHSYISLMVILFLLSIFYKRMESIYFFIPAILVMIPQLVYIKSDITSISYITFIFGWVEPCRGSIFNFLFFWIRNLGIILLLYLSNLFLTKKNLRILYLITFSIFIICNLIKFQPWDFDNLKILNIWLIFIIIGSSEFIIQIYTLKKHYSKVIAILLIFLCIFSGILVVYKNLVAHYEIYNLNDEKIAGWIVSNTNKNSVFLTSQDFNNPIPVLSGRRVYRGYSGWLRSWGMNDNRSQTVKDIYEGKLKLNEIKKLNIDYIYIGRQELNSNDYKINLSFFEENFKKVYDIDNIKIFKIERVNAIARVLL
jgi:hypothetical protein